MKVLLKNSNGVTKEVKVGYSWTTLFFGAFVPLLRGDIKYFLIFLVASVVTVGISHIPMSFVYNKLYIKDLINEGYKPATDKDRTILVGRGIIG